MTIKKKIQNFQQNKAKFSQSVKNKQKINYNK